MLYQRRNISSSVFRAYDIRGIIGQELDEHAFYTIGLAIAYRLNQLGQSQIFIGRDGRLSSPLLSQALKQGLLDSGIEVVNLGIVTSPILYYATHTQGISSGLMVTGSHNAADYNGIKIVLCSHTLTQESIDQLYNLVQEGKCLSGLGKETALDVVEDYLKRIVGDIHIKPGLKVAIDCGNGVAGLIVPKVLHALGCEVIPLYCEIDGHFPNHHPDPTIEANLSDLKRTVTANEAYIGLAFDGDGDRLGVISNLGEMINPDRLLMVYAKELLKQCPGATIVYDVKCSSHLEQVILTAGGIPKMCPTGHSIVKSIMRQEHAVLAGEMSGHLFFKQRWFGFDDALYSACRLLEILSASDLPVSEQFNQIPHSINTPELKIPIAEHEKFQFIKKFSKLAQFQEARLITIDGLRVEFSKGWGLLRASNTSPYLIARFEAEDEETLKTIQQVFREQIHKVDSLMPLPF